MRTGRRFALLALLLSARLASAQAQTQPPVTATAQPAERSYDQVIEEALREYQLGNWEEATALFAQAHALKPSARTLRGMGLSEFENRKYVIALVHCSAALGDGRNPLNQIQRSEVEAVIERAAEFVARVDLRLDPADAGVIVDGAAPYRDAAGKLLLDPGPHELVVSDGHNNERRRIDAASGQLISLAIALRADSSARVAQTPSSARSDRTGIDAAQVLTYAGFAVLGVGLALGTTTGVMVLSKASDLDKSCTDDVCPDDQRKNLEQSEDLAVVANISFAAAGAGAASAVAGLLLANGSSREQDKAGVRVAVQPFGAAINGRF